MAKLINLEAFSRFWKSKTASGILLLSCVVVSIIIANSPLNAFFVKMLATEGGIETSFLQLKLSALNWVNDGLMTVFFLLVALEIKRELVEGELSSFQQLVND